MDELMRLKAAAREQGSDYLTWNDIQACVDQVNFTVQEEHERKIQNHKKNILNTFVLKETLPFYLLPPLPNVTISLKQWQLLLVIAGF